MQRGPCRIPYDAAVQMPLILFGAFDRHNLGDLLFPHIVGALLPGRPLVLAGLAARDLRPFGGHAVVALSQLALGAHDPPHALIHVGGEILTCEAWQAAVMLLPPDEVQPTIQYFAGRPDERRAWLRSRLGTPALAPYTVSRRQFPALAHVVYNAVGGTALDQEPQALRDEVLDKLRAADAVAVRDRQTLAQLSAAGVAARLMPDPAVMLAELFGPRIGECAREGEVAQMLQRFPRGYIALQFSADFGDDESLMQIAAQLDAVAVLHGFGVVLFRAGAAPWHDDLRSLERLARRLRPGSAQVFQSLDLWELCALIAHSRAFCGSSLHGRIVAMAFAVPRINLRPPGAAGHGKHQAFAATWDGEGQPGVVALHDIAAGLHAALAVDPAQLQRQAARLAGLYRQGLAALCAGMDNTDLAGALR